MRVSGETRRAYSAKLLAGTRQRFSGLSHMRQCGDDVLRMFVTGGPGVRGDGGMPPAHHSQLAAGVGVADDRSRIVREDTRHRR